MNGFNCGLPDPAITGKLLQDARKFPHMAEARTKRLLSPRTRQIGQDVAFIAHQVSEKQSQVKAQQQSDQKDHEHLLHIESVRQSVHAHEVQARRTLRQETDGFNAQSKPHSAPAPAVTPGISALLEFAGEQPPPCRRSELVKGLAAQVEAARLQRASELRAQAQAARDLAQLTRQRREIESHENSTRKQLLQAALDVNGQLIDARRTREAAAKTAEAVADAEDIAKCLERVEHKRTVILSLEEQAQILADRAAQVAANEERREEERRAKEAEDERQRQIKAIRDQIAQEEQRERRTLAVETVEDNIASIQPALVPNQAFEYDHSIFAGFGVSGR